MDFILYGLVSTAMSVVSLKETALQAFKFSARVTSEHGVA
jgi:hypothetical protein